MMSWFSTSTPDPKAIVVKCALSLNVFLADPSAIFEHVDNEARLNCDVNPYFSDSGNLVVNA